MKCYQLIGVPGSGKSTWISNQDWVADIPVVSTDNFVEAYAKEQGKTYNEVFKDYMPIAVKLMANQALICQANGLDVIWDQTSTTIASRARKFNTLPKYEHIALEPQIQTSWLADWQAVQVKLSHILLCVA
jgi:predicted kinase